MRIERMLEYEITGKVQEKLQALLSSCFGADYPAQRTYFKQLPHMRLLAFDEAGSLAGQVGLDYRAMNLNGEIIRVMGIIDLCTAERMRSQGVGTALLNEVEVICAGTSVDFLLLFADHPGLYEKQGYKSVRNMCKWLQIDEKQHTTFGIGHRLFEELMVKKVGNKRWQDGELDLMGYLY